MDRRQFLMRAAAVLGALITPAFVRDAQAFARAEGAPLLLPPAVRANRTLIAAPMHRGYSLHIGTPFEPMPMWTWRELAEERGCCGVDEVLEFIAEHNEELNKRERRALLDEPADDWLVAECWDESYASTTLAFNYLDELDLGPAFGESRHARGTLHFIESYGPGDNTRVVEAADALTLSLLQARLVELGEATEIVIEQV